MKELDKLKQTLKDRGLRVTKTRLSVASVLIKNKNSPLTSEEIFNKILKSKKYNCDQVSVYRILATFEELGVVQKSIFQGEATRYKLNTAKGSSIHKHEHFFKCNSCNTIEPLNGCFVAKKEKELESKGYKGLHHHLEITGLCPSCA